MSTNRLPRRAAETAKFLVPLVVGFFIARVIYRNWRQVRETEWQFDATFPLLSLVMTTLWHTVRPWAWQTILADFGFSLPYRAAYRIVRRAELSRFVPGAIWHYVSRVYLASQWGASPSATLAATFIETVLISLASVLPALWSLQGALPFLGRSR